MNKKIVIIGGVAAVILLTIFVYGFASGRLYIGVKDPEYDIRVSVDRVCDNLIDKYNKIVSDNSGSKTQESINDIISDIKSRRSYEQDATCNNMLFNQFIVLGDLPAAEGALNRLKTKTADGANPSLKLVDIKQLYILEDTLKRIKNYSENPSDGDPAGISEGG